MLADPFFPKINIFFHICFEIFQLSELNLFFYLYLSFSIWGKDNFSKGVRGGDNCQEKPPLLFARWIRGFKNKMFTPGLCRLSDNAGGET